jgi:hypothetical protein
MILSFIYTETGNWQQETQFGPVAQLELFDFCPFEGKNLGKNP